MKPGKMKTLQAIPEARGYFSPQGGCHPLYAETAMGKVLIYAYFIRET
jgi:hypothetical protein